MKKDKRWHSNLLGLQLDDITGYPWTREYRFAAIETGGIGKGSRKRLQEQGLKDWRFDFALPILKLAVEMDGVTGLKRTKTGQITIGGHQSPAGIKNDLEKDDAAMRFGWTIYRCHQGMVKNGQAAKTIKILIERRRREEEALIYLATGGMVPGY